MPSAVYPLSRYSFGEHSQIWQLSRILFSLSNQLKVHSAFFHILTAKKHNQQLLLTGIAPPVIQFEILDTVIHEPLMWYKLDSKSGNLYHSIRCPIFSSVLIFPEIQPFSLSTYTDFSIRLFFLIYSRLFLNVPLIHPCTVTKLPPHSIHCCFFFSFSLESRSSSTQFSKTYAAPLCLTFTVLFSSHNVLAILQTGAPWRDAQLLTGQTSSETGSGAVAFLWYCVWVLSPVSQFSCWCYTAFQFPGLVTHCTSLVLAWDTAQYRCFVKPCRHAHKSGNYSVNDLLD